MHEKGLQRQIGVGPLVSSQERRAAVVPRINRSSTGYRVPPSVYMGFRLFVLPKRRSGQLSSMPGGKRDGCLLGEPTRRRPVLPGPAPPPRRAPPRPDPPVVCPGFGLERFHIAPRYSQTLRVLSPVITRADRNKARHSGTAGLGRDGEHRTPTGRFAKETTVPLCS